jgi:hypothetical protein
MIGILTKLTFLYAVALTLTLAELTGLAGPLQGSLREQVDWNDS